MDKDEQRRLDVELRTEKAKQRRAKHTSQSIIGVIGSLSILTGAYILNEPSIFWAFVPLYWMVTEM